MPIKQCCSSEFCFAVTIKYSFLLHISDLDQKPSYPDQGFGPLSCPGAGRRLHPSASHLPFPSAALAQRGAFVSISMSEGLEHTLNIPSPPRLMQMNNKAIFSWEADSTRLICFPSYLRIRGTLSAAGPQRAVCSPGEVTA